MVIQRVANWDTRLVQFARTHLGRDFRWGATDCVTLTRRAVGVILGFDPFGDDLPKIRSKKTALKLKGLDAVECVLSSGAVEQGWHFGWSGDVAVGPGVDAHGLPAVSVLLPQRRALVSTAEKGVIVVDKLDLPKGTRFFRHG